MAAAAIIFAAAVLFCLRKKTEGEWLAREDTTALRGILAVFILFVHLPDAYSYLNEAYAETFEPFIFQGHLAVGAFFALSGYGLALSAGRGLSGFFRKRILDVFIPYLFCSLVFLIARRAQGESVGISQMFASWFSGDPLVTYSWYVVTQMLFYVFFFLVFRFFDSRKMKTAVLFLLVTGYMLLMPYLGWPLVTTRGCLAFVLGTALGLYKEEADAYLARTGAVRPVLISGALFLAAHVLYFAVPFFREHPLFDASSLLFAVFIFLIGRILVPKPPVFHFPGSFSLEIYLYQGLAFTVSKRLLSAFGIKNALVYACFSVFLALAGAFAVHFLYQYFRKTVVKFSIFGGKTS